MPANADQDMYSFPPSLTSFTRMRIHALADKVAGVSHLSQGQGNQRHVCVCRVGELSGGERGADRGLGQAGASGAVTVARGRGAGRGGGEGSKAMEAPTPDAGAQREERRDGKDLRNETRDEPLAVAMKATAWAVLEDGSEEEEEGKEEMSDGEGAPQLFKSKPKNNNRKKKKKKGAKKQQEASQGASEAGALGGEGGDEDDDLFAEFDATLCRVCKKTVKFMGFVCPHCKERYCIKHRVAVEHGCAEAAKQAARATSGAKKPLQANARKAIEAKFKKKQEQVKRNEAKPSKPKKPKPKRK